MLRKTALPMLAVSILAVSACGGGPSSYTLRPDLCEVLDYQAFTRWFGPVAPSGKTVGEAKVVCSSHGDGPNHVTLDTRVEAFKYESPEEAKKVFDRLAKEKSNMAGDLKADVDDVRYYDRYGVYLLDRDLYLAVTVGPQTEVDDSSYKSEMPRLTVEFADQVLERLREKS